MSQLGIRGYADEIKVNVARGLYGLSENRPDPCRVRDVLSYTAMTETEQSHDHQAADSTQTLTPDTASASEETVTNRVYNAWSKVYDTTFGRLVHKRQHHALAQLRHNPGDRVLDLGVGTGMTLLQYPRDMQVVGIDLSPGMLEQAREKVIEHGLDHVELHLGNALETPFADHSFDHVVISHTISVVNDPAALMREAKRLVKPDGRIILLNHFRSPLPVIGWVERVANPLFMKLGWRSDLTFEECLEGVGLSVLYRYKISAIDFWQIAVLSPRLRPLRLGS